MTLNRVTILKLLLALIAILWLFVVVLSYYIVHKPFTLENALAILNALGDVLVAVALFALAATLGRRLTRAFTLASPLEAIVFRAGLGLGVISFVTFALGLAGLLNRVLFWLLLLAAAFLLRADLLANWRDVHAIHLPIASRFERVLAIFLAITFALAFLTALPPTLAWDAQVYHLVAGKIALVRGSIGPPPDNPPLSYPSLIEMLYLAAMVLKDDGATPLIHFGYLLLTLGALWAFSTRYLSRQVAWRAVAILCAVPSFVLIATWPYNDIALAFYAFAAFYTTLVARQQRTRHGFVVAGVFAGLAMGEKYTAVAVPMALLPLILRLRRNALEEAAIVLTFAFVTAAPWYLRNWVFTGNPVFPLVFGGPNWDAYRAGHLNPPPDLSRELFSLLTVPWDATVFGAQGTASFDTTVGPLLLMLLPLLVLLRQREHVVNDALIFSGVLYAFWVIEMLLSRSTKQTRLFFFAFPTLAMLAAIALDRLPVLDLPRFSLARFTSFVVALVLGLTLLRQVLDVIAMNPLAYLAGIESREEFLQARLAPPGYYAAVKLIGTLPKQSKVLFFWEPRDFYAAGDAATQNDPILDAFGHLRYLYHDAAGIAHALREQGYEYVLLNRWGLDFELGDPYSGLTSEDPRILQELFSRYAQQIYGAIPLDFSTDASGRIHVRDVDREAYAVYRLVTPDTGQTP